MRASAAYASEGCSEMGDLPEAEDAESDSSGAERSEEELCGTGGRGGDAWRSGW